MVEYAPHHLRRVTDPSFTISVGVGSTRGVSIMDSLGTVPPESQTLLVCVFFYTGGRLMSQVDFVPTSTVALVAKFRSYVSTPMRRIRRLIDSNLASATAADSAPTMSSAVPSQLLETDELFLLQVDTAKQRCRSHGTRLNPSDTFLALGLGHLPSLNLVVERVVGNGEVPFASQGAALSSLGRSGRMSLKLETDSLGDRRHSSSGQSFSSAAVAPPDVIFVRLLGSCVPKTSRIVLEANPESFVASLLEQADAKLMQVDERASPLTQRTHALFLFTIVGVGSGRIGRRLEWLERIGDLVPHGSNVTTLFLKEALSRTPPESQRSAASRTAAGVKGDAVHRAAMAFCFTSTTWDAEEGASLAQQKLPEVVSAEEWRLEVDATEAAILGDGGGGGISDSAPQKGALASVNAAAESERLAVASTSVRVQLDLPPILPLPHDDDAAVLENRILDFALVEPQYVAAADGGTASGVSASPLNPLEDEFTDIQDDEGIYGPRPREDEEEWVDLGDSNGDCDVTAGGRGSFTSWHDLPFGFASWVGATKPWLYEHAHEVLSEPLTSEPLTSWMHIVNLHAFVCDLEDDERDTHESLQTEVNHHYDAVLRPHEPEITTDAMRVIIHDVMDAIDGDLGNSRDSISSYLWRNSHRALAERGNSHALPSQAPRGPSQNFSSSQSISLPTQKVNDVTATLFHMDVELEDVETVCASYSSPQAETGHDRLHQNAGEERGREVEEGGQERNSTLDVRVRVPKGQNAAIYDDDVSDSDEEDIARSGGVAVDLSGPKTQTDLPPPHWPDFLSDPPMTPEALRQPLALNELAPRVLFAARQHEHFKQQALVPLLDEHRRLHRERVARSERNRGAGPQQRHQRGGGLQRRERAGTRNQTSAAALQRDTATREDSNPIMAGGLPLLSSASPTFVRLPIGTSSLSPPLSGPTSHDALPQLSRTPGLVRRMPPTQRDAQAAEQMQGIIGRLARGPAYAGSTLSFPHREVSELLQRQNHNSSNAFYQQSSVGLNGTGPGSMLSQSMDDRMRDVSAIYTNEMQLARRGVEASRDTVQQVHTALQQQHLTGWHSQSGCPAPSPQPTVLPVIRSVGAMQAGQPMQRHSPESMMPPPHPPPHDDVFEFLSQTLQSLHDYPSASSPQLAAASFSSERQQHHHNHPSVAHGGSFQTHNLPNTGINTLEQLRKSVVAEYTQRLLQERREIDQRALELARLLQVSSSSQAGTVRPPLV